MIKIVIDTKGSDNGAAVMIKGACEALKEFDNLSVMLVGDKDYIENECKNLDMPLDRIEIADAPQEITNYDNPADALYNKTDSSMLVALSEMSKREDLYGLLCAGNTGILLTGAMRYLSGKNRVRPALAAVLPAQNGSFVCLVDTGATIDCTPPVLHHFAKLGSDFMRDMYGIENPKIGLLSNGAESSKGNKLVKETHPLLAEDATLNFVGNIEGNNALSGFVISALTENVPVSSSTCGAAKSTRPLYGYIVLSANVIVTCGCHERVVSFCPNSTFLSLDLR